MRTDAELIQEYAETKRESAFQELVERHLNLVYSTALRLVAGDAHLAQDVAQSVFSDLARKAKALQPRLREKAEVLSGWLYRGTRFAAAKAVRAEQTRRAREQEAYDMQQILHDPSAHPDPQWAELRPVLDDAMGELSATDRDAVLMRFFEGKELRRIGEELGLSEDAARKRIARAVEKLREVLSRRGVKTSTAGLAALLGANALTGAPLGLASTIAATAVAGAAVSNVAALTFLGLMATTQMKFVAAASLFGVGIATSFLVSGNNPGPEPRVVTVVVTNRIYETNLAARTANQIRGVNFRWAQLESADYRQYVANLKGIGCPWDTLKDIIIADLNTLYAPKLAKLRAPLEREEWWLSDTRTRRLGWTNDA